MSGPRVVLLTKDPVPGQVKTRLAPMLGEVGAARLHRAFVHATLDRLAPTGLPITLSLAGDLAGSFAGGLRARGILVEPQAEGDLGARLCHALRGPGRRVALGTDCLLFDPAWVVAAASAADTCIGPAEDGGYWCIAIEGTGGLSQTGQLFEAIDWSTERVLAQTLAAARRAGLPHRLLPRCFDVDSPADLARLLRDPACPPAVHAAAMRPSPESRG